MNFLASICIRRPVFATVLTLVLLVFGAVGYMNLGLDRFPKIDFPIITVTTRLPGSASEEVETEITDKIEEAVNTTSGIEELRSVSSEGISQVFITFVLEKDADVAAQEVRDKVNRILLRPAQGHRAAVRGEIRPRLDARDDHRRVLALLRPRPDGVLRQGAAAAIGIALGRGPGADRRRAEAADQRPPRRAENALASPHRGRRGQGPAIAKPAGPRRHRQGGPARIHAADDGPRHARGRDRADHRRSIAAATRSPSATSGTSRTAPRKSRAWPATTTRPPCS